jgi:exopolysaccharide biosynthesis protein
LVDRVFYSSNYTSPVDVTENISLPAQPPAAAEEPAAAPDPWAGDEDGVKLETYTGPTFTAYVLLVRDPARVFTAVCKSKFSYTATGQVVFDIVAREGILAAINGGGFYDPEGSGGGGAPLGLTYSNGQCLWDDDEDGLTFVGFDHNNRLIARDAISRREADALNIRDGVSFQYNNTLIDSESGVVAAHYAQDATSLNQRTAIGQTADGTVILLVTDGRTASSMGANRNDVINAMLSYHAVTAAMLDGGSSVVMCYPGYNEIYGIRQELDRYQKLGLVNTYRAFVSPRPLPTFFAVKEAD